jgi:surfeit locus 1 family protein
VPPLAALALVILFTMLGFWQLDRADQKRTLEASFEAGGEYLEVTAGVTPELYRRISATGRFLGGTQFLIDNMVQDGRLGYYVITPLATAEGAPLLLVNRGWAARRGDGDLPEIAVSGDVRTVKGRAGHLPRVGVRPGTPLEGAGDWPKVATFPTLEDLAGELGRPVLPFILLADPDPTTSLVRRWQPRQAGPMRHLAYAFQWFALAAAVVVVTAVVYRKQRAER